MPLGVFRCYACGETCIAEDQTEAKAIHRQTACRGTPEFAKAWEEEEAETRPAPLFAEHASVFIVRG